MNCVIITDLSEETMFMLPILAPLFLSISFGLSWNRFLLTFTNRGHGPQDQMSVTTVAATVSLTALALSVADKGPLLGGIIILLGLPLAAISRNLPHQAAVLTLSVVSLAAYLKFTMHVA
ncbi:hypothetical protein BJ928_108194 [Rhizobium sp. WW_1]|jgi:hypothetical protein|nr:hypothetical protein BJ928_108194 [Rhizobium sp. WW_1]